MENDNGFIRLSRKFFSDTMWNEARTFSGCEAWLDLIQSARFDATPRKVCIGGREVICNRGQYPASIRFLSKRWKWSEKKVRSFIGHLKKEGKITVECTQGVNLITLLKYEEYNPLGTTRGTNTILSINDLSNDWAQQRAHPPEKGHTEGTNTKKEYNNKESPNGDKKKKEFDLSFVDENFMSVFIEWLDYKRERRETYKSDKSLQACYRKLITLSNKNPIAAKEIVEQSMANNWAGLFELKKERNGNNRDNYPNKQEANEYALNALQERIKLRSSGIQDEIPKPF